MILNRKLSYKNTKFTSKNEFSKLKLMIDSFLNEESEERYFVFPGIQGVGKTTITSHLTSISIMIHRKEELTLSLKNYLAAQYQ